MIAIIHVNYPDIHNTVLWLFHNDVPFVPVFKEGLMDRWYEVYVDLEATKKGTVDIINREFHNIRLIEI